MAGINDPATVVWVAPDGTQLHLAGGPDQRREGVSLDTGFDGVGGLDPSAAFQAASRQIGETITGWEYSHGEIDLPITVLGESASHMQRTADWCRTLFRRDKPGWLCVFTPTRGWWWMKCRLRSMKAGLDSSPYLLERMHFDIVLLVEDPRAATKPYSSQWRNTTQAGVGAIWLTPGAEWAGWPDFVVHGPGQVSLTMAGHTVNLPRLGAGERALLRSNPAVGVLRSVDADGRSTNRWPDVTGYLAEPIPAGVRSRIDIRVDGGSADTAVGAEVRVMREALL